MQAAHYIVKSALYVNACLSSFQSEVSQYDNYEIDGLAQERRNSIANTLELRLSGTNSSKWKSDLGRRNQIWLQIS